MKQKQGRRTDGVLGGAHPACQQQPSAVGCGVVSQTHRDAVFGQLMRVGSADYHVPFDLRVGNLKGSEQHTHTRSAETDKTSSKALAV